MEMILCIETAALNDLIAKRPYFPVLSEFDSVIPSDALWFAPRESVENRPQFQQIIPYVVLQHRNKFAVYQRTTKGTEKRLHHKYSIGFGGHIDISDAEIVDGHVHLSGTLQNSSWREIQEEILCGPVSKRTTLGIIMDHDSEVGRVHVGFAEVWELENDQISPQEDKIDNCFFMDEQQIIQRFEKMESWSKILIENSLILPKFNSANAIKAVRPTC